MKANLEELETLRRLWLLRPCTHKGMGTIPVFAVSSSRGTVPAK